MKKRIYSDEERIIRHRAAALRSYYKNFIRNRAKLNAQARARRLRKKKAMMAENRL